MGNAHVHGVGVGGSSSGPPPPAFLPWQRPRTRRHVTAAAAQMQTAAAAAAPAPPAGAPNVRTGPTPLHLALLHQSSVVSGGAAAAAAATQLPQVMPSLDAAASGLDQFGNPTNNNGIRPVSANQATSSVVSSHSLLRRSASAQVMLAMRDELFDKSATSLAAFIGVEAPQKQGAMHTSMVQTEPIATQMFHDECDAADGAASGLDAKGAKQQSELIRHLIRSIHSSTHSIGPLLASTPSPRRSPSSSPSSSASCDLSSQLLSSHASNESDDQDLSFRLGIFAQIYTHHDEKATAARRARAARREASREKLRVSALSALQTTDAQSATSAVDMTLRSFVAVNLQLLTAVQRLGASDVISSVLATSFDCFLRVPPLSLRPDAISAAATGGFDLHQVFQPLFTFLTGIAVGHAEDQAATTTPTASSDGGVVVAPRSALPMSDRSKALGILFGAALAAGSLEEILHVTTMLYSHHLRSSAEAAAVGIQADGLAAQIGQFLPALIAFQTQHSSDAAADTHAAMTIDDDSDAAVHTPLFTHAHPLKLVPLAYSGSWVCDSHSQGERSHCHLTGEGYVFHCQHQVDGSESPADGGSDSSCGHDVCTHCVRRERQRQEKVKELRAGFPSLSPNGLIKALIGRATITAADTANHAHTATPPSDAFAALSTPAICAVILSQLDRLSLSFHPLASPSLAFTSPLTPNVRPSNHSLLFDPIASAASHYFTGTTFNSNVIVTAEGRKFREETAPAKGADEEVRDGVRRAGVGTLHRPLQIHVSVRTLTLLSTLLESATTAFTRSFVAPAPSSEQPSTPLWLCHGLIIASCLRLMKAHLYQLHLSQLTFDDVISASCDGSPRDGQSLLSNLHAQLTHFHQSHSGAAHTEQMRQAIDSLARESTEAWMAGFRFFYPTAAAQMRYAIGAFHLTDESALHPGSLRTRRTFLNLYFAHFSFGLDLIDQLAHPTTASETHHSLTAFLDCLMGLTEQHAVDVMQTLSLDPSVARAAQLPTETETFQPVIGSGDLRALERTPTPPDAAHGWLPDSLMPSRRSSIAPHIELQHTPPPPPPTTMTSAETSSVSQPLPLPGVDNPAAPSPPPPPMQTASVGFAPVSSSSSSSLPPLSRLFAHGISTASSSLPSAVSSALTRQSALLILENIQQFLLCDVGRSLQDILEKPHSSESDAAVAAETGVASPSPADPTSERKEAEEKAREEDANRSVHLAQSDVAPASSNSRACEDALLYYVTLLAAASQRTLEAATNFLHAQEAFMSKSESESDGALPAGPRRAASALPALSLQSPTGRSSPTLSPTAAGQSSPLRSTPRHGPTRFQSIPPLASISATAAEQRWDAWKCVCEQIIRNSFVTTLGRPFFTAMHLLLASNSTAASPATGSGPSVAALAHHAAVTSSIALTLLPSLSTLIDVTTTFHSSVARVRADRATEIESEERFLRTIRAQSRHRSPIATIVQGNLAPPTVIFKRTTSPTMDTLAGDAATNELTANSVSLVARTDSTSSDRSSSPNQLADMAELYPQHQMGLGRFSPSLSLLTPLTVRRVGPLANGAQASCALSAHPLLPLPHRETPLLYFEVTIDELGEKSSIGVGFTPANYSLHRMPGWEKDSFGVSHAHRTDHMHTAQAHHSNDSRITFSLSLLSLSFSPVPR